MKLARRLLPLLLLAPAPLRAASPSIEEEAAQLIMTAADASGLAAARRDVGAGLGGVQLQWGSYSLEATRRLTETLQAGASVPLFIGVDYEGGSVYVPTTLGLLELPTNMMLGAADDENNTATLFYLAGKELRRAGINMAFGPVLDVNSNPRNPIIGIRSFGSDPAEAARLGGAVISGFKASGIIAVAKHFPGHGAASQDSHKTLPEIDASTAALAGTDLVPFRAAIAQGVPAVMTAHVLYPALDPREPATLSPAVIGGLLRRDLGFGGLVVTDSLDMRAITSRTTVARAAAAALKAGADLLLIGKGDFRAAVREIAAQVRAGRIPRSRLDEAYRRVLAAKRAAGLFSRPEPPSPFDKAYIDITDELSRRALTAARGGGLLPLPKSKKIAVIIFAPQRFAGNALSLYRALLGNGYEASQYVFDIGVRPEEERKIREAAAAADILVIGSFQWTGVQNASQRAMIDSLLDSGKTSVLLSLMNPYDLANYPKARCALALYGMTAPSMAAAGEALAGELEPAGRLPVALPEAR